MSNDQVLHTFRNVCLISFRHLEIISIGHLRKSVPLPKSFSVLTIFSLESFLPLVKKLASETRGACNHCIQQVTSSAFLRGPPCGACSSLATALCRFNKWYLAYCAVGAVSPAMTSRILSRPGALSPSTCLFIASGSTGPASTPDLAAAFASFFWRLLRCWTSRSTHSAWSTISSSARAHRASVRSSVSCKVVFETHVTRFSTSIQRKKHCWRQLSCLSKNV